VADKKTKKKKQDESDGDENEEGEKKKKQKYPRAPPGSLANPDWERVLGIDAQSKWAELLRKDKLTPYEMMQEAAFTELINKRSLEYLEKLENEKVNEVISRKEKFGADE